MRIGFLLLFQRKTQRFGKNDIDRSIAGARTHAVFLLSATDERYQLHMLLFIQDGASLQAIDFMRRKGCQIDTG